MGAQKSILELESLSAPEFVIDIKKREDQLISRIYRYSHILSNRKLDPEQEQQIKLILEDALAELSSLNEQFHYEINEVSLDKTLFH
jgi:hypothetical protein